MKNKLGMQFLVKKLLKTFEDFHLSKASSSRCKTFNFKSNMLISTLNDLM